MKRTNNKFRNNNYNNQIYSLNYKFDSNSIAGKISGTALDLIKRYNELAKEAHTNNDYVSAEVFRQYAEHYRKIVTEINEKKTQAQNAKNAAQLTLVENKTEEDKADSQEQVQDLAESDSQSIREDEDIEPHLASVTSLETFLAEADAETQPQASLSAEKPTTAEKKSFTVIEIPTSEAKVLSSEESKPKRTYRRKLAASE